MHPRPLFNLTHEPVELFPDDGVLRLLETVIVGNVGGDAAACHIKIWTGFPADPDPEADLPSILLPVTIGAPQLSPFVALPGRSWIACTAEAGLGDTDPADEVNVTVCWDRV